MSQPVATPQATERLSITVRGVVQGVGFRPFVFNAARRLDLAGWVRNEAGVVRIEVQGTPESLEAFCRSLRQPPAQARIESIHIERLATPNPASGPFAILASIDDGQRRPTIPADLATCLDCIDEFLRPDERRYRYPFTNCTNCGPRWSIISGLPYDRPRTSMAAFRMCPACEAEYSDPRDRRFHAQPIACPACGPSLELLDPAGNRVARGDDSLRQAAEAVVAGRVVAIKGVGGFQLLVDATSAAAVARLRARKRRPSKPLAVMMAGVDDVRRYCDLSADEAAALRSPPAPILLLRQRPDGRSPLAEGVAPGNPYLGVMLPYSSLHHLLIAEIGRPVVCTSGNLSEEPMAIETVDALARLATIADQFLVHDRPIVRPVDDSVARITPRGLELLRRARGYAPAPIPLGFELPPILAVGGHLKNTVALSLGDQIVVSQHVGDLDTVSSVELHERTIHDLVEFFAARPAAVACDLHPDYASTRTAERLAQAWRVPLIRVQHHHAHIAAVMAECRLDGPVLGLSWDGTGYGADGTVWGGEMLVCRGGEFQRLARLRTFPLPGGDKAVREPRRSALGLLYAIFGEQCVRYAGEWFTAAELRVLLAMLRQGRHSPQTSSMGRLFDAVACLCRLGTTIDFEGQAAMALEFVARPAGESPYPFPLRPAPAVASSGEGTPYVADWEPLVRAVLDDLRSGLPVAVIAARFHRALAELALAVAEQWGGRQIALGGGCFQNAFLTDLVHDRLAGFEVYTAKEVPPGDGGIALGQVFVAASDSSTHDRA